MQQTDYLIAGASHAGLEAVHNIRLVDQDSSITVITRDAEPPYSPTILPYIVSGQSTPEQVVLRDGEYFKQNNITLVGGNQLVGVDEEKKIVTLASGDQWQYGKLLLATGADPIIPPIPGLDQVPFHVLRTMRDALGLRDQAQEAKSAVVLGAGLIGMHGAENLQHAGLNVTIVEMSKQVLPGYFDHAAAQVIERAFNDNGVTMKMGSKVVKVQTVGKGCKVILESGDTIEAELLLVATGVKPDLDYLVNTSVESATGILVDEQMRTSVNDIWAAGDVAQAKDFYSEEKVLTGILPDAVDQGRIAARDMCQDSVAPPYTGGIPINTYTFFGKQAISVGISQATEGVEELTRSDAQNQCYLKILLKDNQLYGISTINEEMDGGVMWQLIQRKIDLQPVKEAFIKQPLETGRALMSSLWR